MSSIQILPFVYSLALGLLLGIERERSHRKIARQAFGSRTFAVLALVGTLCASLGTWVVAVGLGAVAGLLIAGYRRTNVEDPGTTTEVAGIATYLLGVLCYEHAALAAGLAIVVAVLLISKQRIHAFARELVTDHEVEDALKFFVIAFVVLPLLPDRGIGPYGVLNVARIWLIVVALTGISWVGYVAVRMLGPSRGLLATGLASGFVSATATTGSMGRSSRDPIMFHPALAGAQIASLATLVQLEAIVLIVKPEVAMQLILPLLAGALVLAAVTFLMLRHSDAWTSLMHRVTGASNKEETLERRAFSLIPALVLAVILTTALLAGRWGAATFGAKGAVIAAGAAGIADAHGGAISAVTLYSKGSINLNTALVAIGFALLTNSVIKCTVAFAAGGSRFGTRFALALVPSSLTVLGVLGATMI